MGMMLKAVCIFAHTQFPTFAVVYACTVTNIHSKPKKLSQMACSYEKNAEI